MKKYFYVIVLGAIISILFWWNFADDLFARGDDDVNMQLRKFNYLLYKIREDYVTKPDLTKLVDGAMRGMLEELDPHSIYIPAEEQNRLTERFRGDFEGIGISFVIQNKILTVISPIPGTPADMLGIRAGDKIVEINGKSAYGITNEEVFDKLRGPKGTTVSVTIQREGEPEPLEFEIIRDKIPIHSVETSFMLDDSTGYILLNQFTSNTSEELDEAMKQLAEEGMKRMIFDLRGNSGGYLEQAVRVSDKFIPEGNRLVFTRGRDPESEKSYYSSDHGTYPDLPLIVLISHGSASASEIVAGAVQDLDRGLVVGARSFGKGLVQTPIPFSDGSLVRLTTARYYTPSGRLIQRSYENGLSDYYMDAYSDSSDVVIDSTSDVYYTKSGRKVYGGGGIEPDVKLEPAYFTRLGARMMNQRLYFEYATDYAGKHPELGVDFDVFLDDFEVSDEMMAQFRGLAEAKDIEVVESDWEKDMPYFRNLIKAELAQILFNGRIYYYRVRMQGDEQVKEALTLFPQATEIAELNR